MSNKTRATAKAAEQQDVVEQDEVKRLFAEKLEEALDIGQATLVMQDGAAAESPVVPGQPTTLASSTQQAMHDMQQEHVAAAGLSDIQRIQIKTMIDQGIGLSMHKAGITDLTITTADLLDFSLMYEVVTEPLDGQDGYTIKLVDRVKGNA